ncbi:MAG TPA: tRNA (adenosine(37)-N6)-threonylcarbamoyltransferase complex dimerization subunit type 1 TsaB, partial [Chthoniobacteraceae bacterium]|nr:tRNA (adenosine(37)-N6)-threonylcarbamoyltransferase complex dimerization subunit type 1 TsaB [Chthoniobacteraceae bacterium]
VLALELSAAIGSVAFCENGERLFRAFPADRKDSGLFYENLEKIYRQGGPPDLVVVGLGPGSYAGVRIAIATAVGMKAATNARLVGLPSVCAIDQSEYIFVGDARRSSFFFAHVARGCCVEGPKLASEGEIRAKLQARGQLPCVATHPLPQFEDVTIEHPSALRLVELATEVDCLIEENLEPIYLREPYITTPR